MGGREPQETPDEPDGDGGEAERQPPPQPDGALVRVEAERDGDGQPDDPVADEVGLERRVRIAGAA